jgi:sugar phosphate isomerase/epimerase
VVDVEVIWLQPGSDMAAHKKIIDVGAELGAQNVLCVSSETDMGVTAARLHELCVHAEGTGLRVALEFGIFTEVKTLTMAMGVLDQVGHPLRALLIDPIHVNRSQSTIADIAKIPRELLPYAQFCDAPAKRRPGRFRGDHRGCHRPQAAMRRRRAGARRYLQGPAARRPAQRRTALQGPARQLPDPGKRARAVAEATRRWLARNG